MHDYLAWDWGERGRRPLTPISQLQTWTTKEMDWVQSRDAWGESWGGGGRKEWGGEIILMVMGLPYSYSWSIFEMKIYVRVNITLISGQRPPNCWYCFQASEGVHWQTAFVWSWWNYFPRLARNSSFNQGWSFGTGLGSRQIPHSTQQHTSQSACLLKNPTYKLNAGTRISSPPEYRGSKDWLL